MLIGSLAPGLGRKMDILFVALFYLVTIFLATFFLNKAFKPHELFEKEVILFYITLFTISSGMWMNALFSSDELNIGIAFGGSIFVFIVE